VERVADGGAPSQALLDFTRFLGHANLDENAGEGYHRGTHHELVRAPSSTTAHLKQQVRIKSVMAEIREFVRKYHAPGRAVIRFEMLHWQRILQTDPEKKWQPKRMHPQLVFAKVYREDDRSLEDWSSICQHVPQPRPVVTENLSNREQLEAEYLAVVLRPQSFFSVQRTVQQPTDEGATEEVQRDVYFNVLSMQQAKSREHTMHTFISADDPLKVASLVLQVRMLDKWDPPGRDADGLQVMHEGDDEWMPPWRLGTFEELSEHLSIYRRVDPSPDEAGVLVLSDCRAARSPYALTDMRSPTLSLVRQLKKDGWVPFMGHVRHGALPIEDGHMLPFDSREAVRMKAYYMCLLDLARVLPLAGGTVPSQEGVAFYKCLLRGDRCVPGQSAKQYTLQWNRGRLANAEELLALPPPEPPKPLTGGEDFEVRPVGWVEPETRKSGGRGPIRGGRGRGGTPGRGGAGRGGPAGRGTPVPLPGLPPPTITDPPPPAQDEDFEADAVVAPAPAPARILRPEDERGVWQDGLHGATIMFDIYSNKKTGKKEPNWKLKCRYHEGCVKRRGAIPRWEARHGIIEPVAFLHCWEVMETPSSDKVKSHVHDEPEMDAVDEYVLGHAAELRALVEDCNR